MSASTHVESGMPDNDMREDPCKAMLKSQDRSMSHHDSICKKGQHAKFCSGPSHVPSLGIQDASQRLPDSCAKLLDAVHSARLGSSLVMHTIKALQGKRAASSLEAV